MTIRACFFATICITLAHAQTPISIPDGKVGETFSYRITIEGGTPPFHFKLSEGTLPAGLQLDANTGAISGTPSTAARQAFPFTVAIRDDSDPQQEIRQAFTLKIAPAPMRVVAGPAPMRVVMHPREDSVDRTVPPPAPADTPTPAPAPQAHGRAATGASADPPAAAASLKIVSGDRQSGTIKTTVKGKLVVKALDSDNTAAAKVDVKFSASDGVTDFSPNPATTAADGTASTTVTLGGTTGKITITAEASGAPPVYFWVDATPPEDAVNGDLTRTVLGLEQVGASSANSVAKFFFDFYNDRPVGVGSGKWGSPFRWWGNVRIGSIPVQTTAAISSLAKSGGIVSQASKLTLNEIAQAAEFQSGFALNIGSTAAGPLTPLDHGKENTIFSLFVGGGASLPFNPRSDVNVFDLPPLNDPTTGAVNQGRQRFNQSPLTGGYKNTTATQVAFTTPDRNQFFRQYFAGVRLNTMYEETDTDGNAVRSLGTVSFSIGQNEAVTGGKLRGLVAEADAFFPLPISVAGRGYGGFYLFGRAMFQLNASLQTTPLLLTPSNTQPSTFDNVLVIASPSRRDLYSIGVGLDALRFAKALLAQPAAAKK